MLGAVFVVLGLISDSTYALVSSTLTSLASVPHATTRLHRRQSAVDHQCSSVIGVIRSALHPPACTRDNDHAPSYPGWAGLDTFLRAGPTLLCAARRARQRGGVGDELFECFQADVFHPSGRT